MNGTTSTELTLPTAERRQVLGDHRRQALARAALVAWLVVVLMLTLFPNPGRGQSYNLRPGADLSCSRSLLNLGVNLLLFAPLGAFATAAQVRLGSWWRVLAVATALSLTIEAAQWVTKVGRAADANDVVGNAAGALVAFAVTAVLAQQARRRRPAATSDGTA